MISEASKSFYSGRGQTWVVMVVDAAVAIFELVLNYVWIFGYWGFPAMGLAGAAWSTVVGTCVKAIVYVVLPLQREHRERYGTLAGMRFDAELMRRIVYFGWPSGFQMLLDVMGFTVFIFMLGAPRRRREAGHEPGLQRQLARLHADLRIAHCREHSRRRKAGRKSRRPGGTGDYDHAAIVLAVHGFYFAACMHSVPDLFLVGFFRDGVTSSAEQLAVRELTATLLLFVAGYNLLDATQMIYIGALKGAGDTRFLLWVSLVLATLLAQFQLSQRRSLEAEHLRLLDAHRLLVPDRRRDVLRAISARKMASMRVIETASDDSIDAMTIAALD